MESTAEYKTMKIELGQNWAEWIQSFASWKLFLTLTFSQADRHYSVSQEQVDWYWRTYVRVQNKDLLGNNYTRKVGHSYFPYILAVEPHRSGHLHAHALVGLPINLDLFHMYWNKVAGFEKVEHVREENEKLSRYLSKYIVKGGLLYPYKPMKPVKLPDFLPYWWQD